MAARALFPCREHLFLLKIVLFIKKCSIYRDYTLPDSHIRCESGVDWEQGTFIGCVVKTQLFDPLFRRSDHYPHVLLAFLYLCCIIYLDINLFDYKKEQV